MLKIKMSKVRGNDGKLKICKLSAFELHQVRYVLESLSSGIINKGGTKPIILATGCYRSYTIFRDDFVEGDLVWLCHTHLMDGVGASLEETH